MPRGEGMGVEDEIREGRREEMAEETVEGAAASHCEPARWPKTRRRLTPPSTKKQE